MAIFAIADLHLSLGTDKPMDVFAGWDGYLPRLEQNWRRLVSDEDTVVIPGISPGPCGWRTAGPILPFCTACREKAAFEGQP